MKLLAFILFLECSRCLGGAIGNDATNHWSFRHLVRPPVPNSYATSAVARNPIDSFVFARLAQNQLSPSPEADRGTLIRRLYFDLTGLPPTPEEVAAYAGDARADSYERLVDRLLASPHFGERWARHWLDVVHFAETHGFEMNNPRPNAWPYRDYVIRAFNEDKPYDRFVMEQIAGDALGADEATGFLVTGPWDQVKSPDEVLTKNQRADELHDIVSTTGTAFLGLTLGCARCHDHKFDPVPQRDYYAIKAVFAGVNHGERVRHPKDEPERKKEAEAAQTRLNGIETQLSGFEPVAQTGPNLDTNRLRAPVHPRMNVERFAPVAAKRLRFTINATTDAEPCLDELEVYAAATDGDPSTPAALRNIALASLGARPSASGTYPDSDLHKLEHLNDGRVGNSRSWISNEKGRGWVELEFPEAVTISRVVWSRDREEKFKDRLATDYRIEVAVEDGRWRLMASSADRRPFKPGEPFMRDLATNGLSAAQAAQLASLSEEENELKRKLTALRATPMIYAGEFKPPEPTRRFNRGDPMQPREVIEPGVSSFAAFQCSRASFATNSTEQEGRLALAQWIASPENPLTARVIVNRLWQYHFGEGLVSTPSDFGRNGAQPSNPELLDWLAGELVAHRWSLKHVHRLIVTSATYRQSSAGRQDGLAVDAGARLLWRFPPRRLEAEALRDAILAVAGKLDSRMGGPGWSPFEPNENYVRVYTPKQNFAADDFRRMVYATVIRQRPDGVFGAFDCPDGGQIAPKRTRSTTPLQALNLLNSGFIMQAAGFFAGRLERDAGNDVNAQVRRAFLLSFQREPSPGELAASVALIRGQGLKVFCRALFNANEFAYVF